MTEKRIYSIERELKGQIYRAVLEFAAQHCPTALLVARDPRRLTASGNRALEILEPYLIDVKEVSEWPGTTIFGHTATLYRYKTSLEIIEKFCLLTDGLYSWLEPDLPEDLCFLRSDDAPWLGSISHEGDAFFELTEEEAQVLFDRIPELANYSSKD